MKMTGQNSQDIQVPVTLVLAQDANLAAAYYAGILPEISLCRAHHRMSKHLQPARKAEIKHTFMGSLAVDNDFGKLRNLLHYGRNRAASSNSPN
ncbi:hypothetical protein GCM10027038_09170 [Arthrobacter bambusae]